MYRKSFEIVGYVYAGEYYCPNDIIDALPTGEGEAFDGWKLADGVRMSTEDNLSEIAVAFGIDRMDESSFDSDDFPKVVFLDQVSHESDFCATCHSDLSE